MEEGEERGVRGGEGRRDGDHEYGRYRPWTSFIHMKEAGGGERELESVVDS